MENGLICLPAQIEGMNSSGYLNRSLAYRPGYPFLYRMILSRKDKDAISLKEARKSYDNNKIGQMLGYPECCCKFFYNTYVKEHYIDTTWPMAVGKITISNNFVEIPAIAAESNILWRWTGIRMVPHLPCSFSCIQTIHFGKQLYKLALSLGFETEIKWLLEILSWPVEWSALHGIAEIKTPLLKISTMTDATAEKYTVRYKGIKIPDLDSKGLVFPYIRFVKDKPEDRYFRDNGFSSIYHMNQSHKPIVDFANSFIRDNSYSIIDLGCGNGSLLKKIKNVCCNITPFGIDHDKLAIEHGRTIMPEYADNFILGDIFESIDIWKQREYYDIALLMPGRLTVVNEDHRNWLKKQLKKHCKAIIIYLYNDWLGRSDGLKEISKRVGITLINELENQNIALAKIE